MSCVSVRLDGLSSDGPSIGWMRRTPFPFYLVQFLIGPVPPRRQMDNPHMILFQPSDLAEKKALDTACVHLQYAVWAPIQHWDDDAFRDVLVQSGPGPGFVFSSLVWSRFQTTKKNTGFHLISGFHFCSGLVWSRFHFQ